MKRAGDLGLDDDHHHGHRRHRHHGKHGRLLDYGELRLLVIAMLAEQPSHGYELMRAIGERMGGDYTPSPGVIYPTLAWLEDMGYAQVEAEASGRKRYRVTPEGAAFLTANTLSVEAMHARLGNPDRRREGVPAPVGRAMENLKHVLRLRLRRAPMDQAATDIVAGALDEAARKVERS